MTITVGPLAFQALHLILLSAFIIALLAGRWAGRKQQVKVSPTLFDMAFGALVAGRVVFVATWFGQYWQAPWTILDIRDGGFNAWAALAAAVALAAWRLWRTPALREPVLVALLAGVGAALVAGAPTLLRMDEARTVPPVALETREGRPVALDRLAQGKPMVVNLWATWCPPCRREMPVLAQAQRGDSAVVFVFVNQGEGTDVVDAYLSKENIALRNVLMDRRKVTGLAVGSLGLPTTLFYDASGRLVELHLGPLSAASLEAKLTGIRPRP
ncbi:redoxin family protein [Massilia sp. PAMC28688]|uniref:TlpA disulfide reductase family protein n=1 Tax=Massilia sp. PAMC28688 TaxID=2861283 RepID=UPI001C62AC76|nr:TlpA disulfide reductase family protein [Massilia sp. PAMC28688]QYF93671.1 redoxin family protein [Massilia sp. PAMC28688]